MDLKERLRRLREVPSTQPPAAAAKPRTTPAAASAPAPPASKPKQLNDEAEDLITRMQAEVELEKGQGRWQDDEIEGLSDEDEADEAGIPSYLAHDIHQSMNQASLGAESEDIAASSKTAQDDASRALSDWSALRREAQDSISKSAPPDSLATDADPPAAKLVKEPREKPSMLSMQSRGDESALTDDLAEAMGGGIGESRDDDRLKSVARTLAHNDDDIEAEADDLVARLTKLRGAEGSNAAADAQSPRDNDEQGGDESSLLALPSVPTDEPRSARTLPVVDDQKLPADLRPYSKLARMNVSLSEPDSLQARLDALKAKEAAAQAAKTKQAKQAMLRQPSAQSKASLLQSLGIPRTQPSGSTSQASKASAPQPDSDEEDAGDSDTDTWCCICNADATLRCTGCDFDLYCSECWAEGHVNMGRDELREHKTSEFRPRRQRGKGGSKGAGTGSWRGIPA